ncbi:CitMHS family transporter [Wohlfahrtiimonas populi]|uniref:CitMHS family transporter n=1 Tax=Wohlfahrtiimonas populi TaxID=1940240 RepID=UPI00098D33A9|nr:citrate:proton symporter [Wohlfahrtiimonas populi]
MVELVGFLTVGMVVLLLILGKTNPIVALVGVPIIGALLLGYSLQDINGFFSSGLGKVISVAVMFIFAILFFGVMNHIGLFDPVINGVIKITQGHVVLIAIGTVIVGSLAHLDGSGATTFLVSIPAFLPIYRKMKMSPNLLVMLVAGSIGIVNLLPWGGPLARSASVLSMDVAALWRPLIPLQLIGLLFLVVFAAIMGLREQKRILAGKNDHLTDENLIDKVTQKIESFAGAPRGKTNRMIYAINWILFIGILVILLGDFLQPSLAFLVGLVIALPLNYKTTKEQADIIKESAPNAILMASIIISAGMFLGILNGTGMLKEMTVSIVSFMPNVILPYLYLIVGFFGLPLDLVTSTDAYYFALLPIILEISAPFGVDPSAVVYSLAIGNNFGAMISPLAPSTWLGVGLAGVSIGSHIRYSFIPMWIFSLVLLALAFVLGLI